jgi:hypothetical protein
MAAGTAAMASSWMVFVEPGFELREAGDLLGLLDVLHLLARSAPKPLIHHDI